MQLTEELVDVKEHLVPKRNANMEHIVKGVGPRLPK